MYSPQIFKGASNSNKIGCCKNISRDFKQSPLTSASDICTCLPGLFPLTVNFTGFYIDFGCKKHKEKS